MLAFAAVIVTFGITTAVVLLYLNNFGVEIGVIKTGYLPLALGSKDFASRQEDLRSYLAEDFREEASTRNAARTLARYRRERDKTLRETFAVLRSMSEVPERHQRRLAEASTQITALSDTIDQTARDYALLLVAPPIAANHDSDSPARAAAAAALVNLVDQEKIISSRAGKLAEYLKSLVTKSASNLEDNERSLRLYTLAWAGGAIVLGILLSVWASLALRPLRVVLTLRLLCAQFSLVLARRLLRQGGTSRRRNQPCGCPRCDSSHLLLLFEAFAPYVSQTTHDFLM